MINAGTVTTSTGAARVRAGRYRPVTPVHKAIKGRTRFRIEGLYRCPLLKVYLEQRMLEFAGVTEAQASSATGNLLLRYELHHTVTSIAALLEEAVAGFNGSAYRGKVNGTADDSDRAAPRSALRDPAPAAPGHPDGEAQRKLPRRELRLLVKRADGQELAPWHVLSRAEVLDALSVSATDGLSNEEAAQRYRKYGPNVLPEAVPRSGLSIFIDQFRSVPVGLLAVAAAVSAATGGITDGIAIIGVVAINAVIGYVTESQTEKTIHSLKSLIRPRATMLRQGAVLEEGAERIVPGDLLLLQPGNYVAADARLIEANRLSIDESALTGESVPATKDAAPLADRGAPLSDRRNMCYMGTLVTGGQGLAVAVATGRYTEVGRIQLMIGEAETPSTPMERQLDQIGTQLVVVSAALCGVVFLLGLVRGYGFVQMLKMSLSLAVAAVPEGLPAVATTTLALGIREMRQHKVLIRHLDAIEALGAAQVICLDKTGTITVNRMTVVAVDAGGDPVDIEPPLPPPSRSLADAFCCADTFELLCLVSCLCSESEVVRSDGETVVTGSPTENALVHMALDRGLDVIDLFDQAPRQRVVHRSEGRNYMVTVHRCEAEQQLIAVKGSPSELIRLCRYQMAGGKVTEIGDEEQERLLSRNETMASKGLRVLAVAYALVPEGIETAADDESFLGQRLVWLGLVGMADPVRPGVAGLMQRFHGAGIKTVMITGDQSPTAFAVGQTLGLGGREPLQILDSTSFAHLSPEAMQALARRANVFSRVSPAHKLAIVQALQREGLVVGMTGDGINDGPALKAADIGIAMGGTGTDVAREVADVILEDDNLETMMVAIGHGRAIHANIRKALHFLLSTNLSEIIVAFVANVGGMGQPLSEMQLLWINLITDIFPGLALSLEPPEQDALERPPRDPQEPIVPRDHLAQIAREATVISTGSLGCYGYGIARYGIGPRASSLAFLSLTVGQLLHALSCRSRSHTIFEHRALPPNPHLNLALGGSFALQALALLFPGFRSLLGIGTLAVTDLLVVGGAAGLPLLVNESIKNATLAGSRQSGPAATGRS